MTRTAVIAAIVLVLAAAAAPGGGARASSGTCPPKAVAGAKWKVLITHGVSCGTAYSVIAKLAVRRIPPSRVYSGTYAGMSCFGGPKPGSLPRTIDCGTKSRTHMFSSLKGW